MICQYIIGHLSGINVLYELCCYTCYSSSISCQLFKSLYSRHTSMYYQKQCLLINQTNPSTVQVCNISYFKQNCPKIMIKQYKTYQTKPKSAIFFPQCFLIFLPCFWLLTPVPQKKKQIVVLTEKWPGFWRIAVLAARSAKRLRTTGHPHSLQRLRRRSWSSDWSQKTAVFSNHYRLYERQISEYIYYIYIYIYT